MRRRSGHLRKSQRPRESGAANPRATVIASTAVGPRQKGKSTMTKDVVQPRRRPVPAELKHLRRGKLLAASSLSPVEEEGIGAGRFRKKQRPNEYWAIFNGGRYVVTTGTKDEQEAQDFLEVYKAQAEAKREGQLDVRFADATEVIDAFVAKKGRPAATQGQIERGMHFLRPFVAGKLIRQLDDEWLEKTWEALKNTPQRQVPYAKTPPKVGYADATIWVAIAWLTVAIMTWCRKHQAMPFLPFTRPVQPEGRNVVFDSRDQRIIERWSRGTEDYDAKTGKWTPAKRPLNGREILERRMIDRMWTFGLATGSRPGNIWGVATQKSLDCPYILVEEETLYRLPVGAKAPRNKQAPPVKLSPAMMAEVHRFVAEDGPDEVYLLRTWERTGGPARPLSRRSCSPRWKKAMRKLGIKGRRHACRHTAVTSLVLRNVPAIVIGATAGMSLRTLKNKYNHAAERDVQPIAHSAIDALLAKGLGIVAPKRVT